MSERAKKHLEEAKVAQQAAEAFKRAETRKKIEAQKVAHLQFEKEAAEMLINLLKENEKTNNGSTD